MHARHGEKRNLFIILLRRFAIAEIGEVDRMDEDTLLRSVAVSEEVLPTSSEHPKASASPGLSTGKKGDENSTPQPKVQYTFDVIMVDRYSPTASSNSRRQPTPGNGVHETSIGHKPSGDDKAQHSIGNSPIRLRPFRKPQEVLITDCSPSWKLLAEALKGSPSITTEAHRRIAAGSTRSMRSEIQIKMQCTVLHTLPRHHVIMEMVRAVKHQMLEVTELVDVHQLIRLILPQPM